MSEIKDIFETLATAFKPAGAFDPINNSQSQVNEAYRKNKSVQVNKADIDRIKALLAEINEIIVNL